MEILIITGIVVAVASWWGIFVLIKNLEDGKEARAESKKARSEFFSLKKEYDSLKDAHGNELQTLERSLRLKIEQQGNVIHDVKTEFKRTKEQYEKTIRQKDQLFEQIKKRTMTHLSTYLRLLQTT